MSDHRRQGGSSGPQAGAPSRPRNPTRRGYSLPHHPNAWANTEVTQPSGTPLPAEIAQQHSVPPPRPEPPIEVVLVNESRPVASDGLPWRAFEVWTKNRIYGLDSQGVCIEVIDRTTNRRETSHSLLGAKLSGGQRRDGESIQLAHPFPIPGTEAVFKHMHKRHGHYGQTSKVERVVIRMRVTTVTLKDAEPAWEQITASGLPRVDPKDYRR
jgi:hypothetical protein